MKLFMQVLLLSLNFSRLISLQNRAFVINKMNGFFHRGLATSSNILNARIQKKNKNGKSIEDDNANSSLYKPRTENQVSYVKYLTDITTPIVVGVGPAGSGKTLFACIQAVSALKSGFIQKIILTRPVVPVEEDMGFLPGDLNQKMDPWTRPIFDILLEFYQQKDIDTMLHNGVLEISPLAYMRGRTFKNAFIIADEMQNSSPNQMLMLTTRIGIDSKLVITGDLQQCDRGAANGLADFIGKIRSYEIRQFIDRKLVGKKKEELGIRIIEMKSKDIQRSAIVSKLIDIYSVKPTVPSVTPSSREPTVPSDAPSLLSRERAIALGGKLVLAENDKAFCGNYGSLEKLGSSKREGASGGTAGSLESDAALIPNRYNITDVKKYPWTPMDF